MDRREFSRQLLWSISGILLLQTATVNRLVAKPYEKELDKWIRSLQELCRDLRSNKLTVSEWQLQIATLHDMLGLEDLSFLIDFEKAAKVIELPHLGVGTKNYFFPLIADLSDKYTPIGRIFGMKKDRAIIPHGHRNMVSCHRVIKGHFLLRQYDRINDDENHMYIKQTIEEMVHPGSHSSISDDKNNVHWLLSKTEAAYTFDVIVANLGEKETEIDNLDIDSAVKSNDTLRVKKIKVGEALEKYGYDLHH